ncbi:tyrosine-type recombinase/integrase [Marinactinospora thermotolerans]|uniref:tyrosine-type recombinase/integrase n=1 Tax=Marinactinospora thermotolerans TaxID=531310 RepID=UPI003D8AB569
MARVWVEDRNEHAAYRAAVEKAKAAKRTPPGRWRVRWYDPAGKPKAKVFTKKPQAENYRTEIENGLAEGSYRDPSAGKIRFREVAAQWIDAQALKRSSRSKYRDVLEDHILPRWGDLPVKSIEFDDVAAWLAGLQKPKEEGGRNLGASQTRTVHSVLSMVLDWCVPRRLAVNPAKGVPLPKLPPSDHVYLTYEQVEALATAAGELRTKYGRPTATAGVNRTLILLLAYTGLRWGEASALRVKHVDLDRRRIKVTTAFNEVDGELYEDTPKTGERRVVPLLRSLVEELRPLVAGREPDALVFRTGRDKPLRIRNWRNREFNKARKNAGLDGIGLTIHKLRHTAASLSIAGGADVYVVQRMLGHAKPSMTLDTYGHLWPDRLDEVADVIDLRRVEAVNNAAKRAA